SKINVNSGSFLSTAKEMPSGPGADLPLHFVMAELTSARSIGSVRVQYTALLEGETSASPDSAGTLNTGRKKSLLSSITDSTYFLNLIKRWIVRSTINVRERELAKALTTSAGQFVLPIPSM